MSPTRIHKIKKIDDYRIFQGWKPSGGVEFGRVNVIYGQNGSGKSTLASLLQGCAAFAADQSTERDTRHAEIIRADPQFVACDPSDTSTSGTPAISLGDRTFWARVRVFNKDFVRRNLRFEEVDGPQPEVLLTIGESLADAEKKLEELRPELRVAKQGLDDAEDALRTAQKNVDNLGTKVAREIVEHLSGAPGFNARSYNRKRVQDLLSRFETDPTVLGDASTDPIADRRRAVSRAMEPVSMQRRGVMLEQDGLDEARRLLATTVLNNQRIEELVGHAQRSRWVQQGLDLHVGLEECLFCGQELTAERIDALNAHFDESFKKLQEGIDNFLVRLEESVAASKTYLDDFPAGPDVYEDLKDDLQKAHQEYRADHEAYLKAVERVAAALGEKKDNPFGTPALTSDLVLVAPKTAALEKVVEEHQGKIDGHEKEAAKAAARVERYYVKNAAGEYLLLKKEVEGKSAVRNKFKDDIKELEEQVIALENVDGDPVPGAKELTEGLRGLLGRDELKFSVEDSKHYVIKRGGTPATHLSEGEQTAIALLYFLASVRENKIKGDPPIVVIDDPVSSLDHGIHFGVSAHIWEELVVNTYASQVFLLTHNFELFRQWLIQMERVPRKSREGGYAAFSVRTRLDKTPCRVPEFELWELNDSRRKKLRSQYHFLFDQVARTLIDSDARLDSISQMEAAALVPNTARKLLEGFLSFRSPSSMGDLRDSVRAALKMRPGLDVSVRTMVVRYAHANSHLEEADPTKPLDPSEAVPFLRALFKFMDHVDGDHFRSMCDALGHDPNALLGVSASSAPGAPT